MSKIVQITINGRYVGECPLHKLGQVRLTYTYECKYCEHSSTSYFESFLHSKQHELKSDLIIEINNYAKRIRKKRFDLITHKFSRIILTQYISDIKVEAWMRTKCNQPTYTWTG